MSVEKEIFKLHNSLNVQVERHVFDTGRKSVILVNGALATTASFGQTIKYLGERYNVICFDLPYVGQSKQHNRAGFLLTKEDEVEILLRLIQHFEPKYLYSVSWGGLASLLALARQPASVERAVIGSFSPFLNDAMLAYVTRARNLLCAGENLQAAQLLNDTVGKHLPRILKLLNFRYLTSLPKEEQSQVAFHVNQILALRPETYLDKLASIRCRVKFINGELDEYTTSEDIRTLARYVMHAHFATVPNTGHFLELEGRTQAAYMREAILDFFGADQKFERARIEGLSSTPVAQTFAPSLNTDFGG
ncbi:alpha/beta fold hydrolase [Paraburkholderia kirstenboschensis]|uniref:Alpha/beta hydrolase n=1 Tax=Paraburkholderia kirstenboschensis TaxID=1245436 RepID=A0ABZ0EDN4_9BURK|nr:alpha/beta hydrolase [Paraburkholderia kirstenboschensis]WOD14317.1 alpha/beta hydrolase [Paraburkholderia kirstenboschensis]